jgi:hypothetical protein
VFAAPPEAVVEEALRRALAAEAYQTRMPGAPTGESPPAARPPAPAPGRTSPRTGRADTDLKRIGRVLAWLVMSVIAVAGAAAVLRALAARRRDRALLQPLVAAAPPAASPEGDEQPRGDGEALARAGRYAEAVRAVLLATLEDLERTKGNLKPDWTSREILDRWKLGEGLHRALAALVYLVEVTRFGSEAAGEEDYRRATRHRAEILGSAAR